MTSRRAFLTGLSAVIAAPAIVRVSSLMSMPRSPVRLRPWEFSDKVQVILNGIVISSLVEYEETVFHSPVSMVDKLMSQSDYHPTLIIPSHLLKA